MKQLFSALLSGTALLISVSAQAATWTLDKAHTEIGFEVTHMMVSTVHGTFDDFDGTVQFDPQNPGSLAMDVTIQTASIDTRTQKRDDDLRSERFFDAAKNPTITFKSTMAEKIGDGHYKVTGDLTMHGITKPITLDVTGFKATIKDQRGNMRTGASATATISRKDWGLTWNAALEAGGVVVSDEVTIRIDAELVEQTS